ncbi:two-component regulator propeller domain-containing protein [Melioribacteraceae bacterium 4301-Me]|uniref:type IX secretion system anionic LPS delivery protein PorZ n=1 Tax=Pyranulibacter aquaticus TaxID=3163344 RepID=UPI003596E043
MFLKLLLYLLVPTFFFAQEIGVWKNYSDMKTTMELVITNDGFWAAASGGIFKFSEQDSSYKIINKSDGLSSQILTSIAIDKEGKVWIGSQEGYINSYNPNNANIIKILDIYNSSKSQKQINNISSVGDTIYVATDFGISLINPANGSFYDSFLKLGSFASETKVKFIFKDKLLYAATELGIAIQKQGATNLSAPESWDNFYTKSQIAATVINSVGKFGNKILASTDNGLFRLAGNNWEQFSLSGTNINQIASIDTNKLYAVSDTKIFLIENGQPTEIYSNDGIKINSIKIKNDGTIYCATNKGILRYKNGNITFLFPNGPESNHFINLAVDNDGKLWVATGNDVSGIGIFEFDGSNWKVYNTGNTNSFLSNAFHNVYAAPDNTKYFCNWGKGFSVLKNGTFRTYSAFNSSLVGIPKDPNFVVIYDIKTDSKGNAWMTNLQSASRTPLSVLTTNDSLYHYNFTNPLITENELIGKLAIDQYDTKWFIVTFGDRGLYYFNENGTITNLTDDKQGYLNQNNGLISDEITTLTIDKRGQLWVGTNQGISVIQDVTHPLSSITNSVGFALRNQFISAIAVDPLDQKWIGTNNGVYLLSQDGLQLFNHFTASNSPLPSDNIKSIAIDEKNGIIYIGTDFGLSSLKTASIQPKESFNELFVYPNPIILTNNKANTITIDGLVKNSRIKIYDINGKLIADLSTPGGRIAFWDCKDLSGNLVSSGIYIIFAFDEEANNVSTAKLAVIKK